MGWQSVTNKMSYLQKNGQQISDPYFYHCYHPTNSSKLSVGIVDGGNQLVRITDHLPDGIKMVECDQQQVLWGFTQHHLLQGYCYITE